MILLASRLIKEKGLLEYVEAARILKSKGVEVSFALAGQLDPGNRSSITEQQLQEWCAEGIVDYLGQIEQIEDVIDLASIVALPSYREGTPRILLEAAASGKPIVATDVPGCREVVKHGVNGFLVPARDAVALADAIEGLLKQPQLMAEFGRRGREIAKEFEESNVIEATVRVYERALPRKS